MPLVLRFIKDLAAYEKLLHEVTATEALLTKSLFGRTRVAEAIICENATGPVGFAVFFPTFSTFLGKSGVYIEDLFVNPDQRGHGYGRAMLQHIANRVRQANGKRLEWSVLNWNEPSIGFYKAIGAKPVDGWTKFRLDGQALAKLGKKVA